MSGLKKIAHRRAAKQTAEEFESKDSIAVTDKEVKLPLKIDFEGIDTLGRNIKGSVPFENEDEARHYLTLAGVQVTHLKPIYQRWYQVQILEKMPSRVQYAQLAKNLAQAFEIGQSPFMICKRFSKSSSNKILKNALDEASFLLERGKHWDEAFSSIRTKGGKPVFPVTFIYALNVAELLGNFQMLRDFADAQMRASAIQKKIIKALIYPACVMVAVFIAFVVEVYYVMPMFAEIFKGMLSGKDDQLPFITQFMIDLSSYFTSLTGVLTLLAFITAVGGLFYYFFRHPKGIEIREIYALRIWKFGDFYKNYHASIFCRTLSMLWEGETNIKKRFNVVAHTSTNPRYRQMGEHIEELLNNNPPDTENLFTGHYDLLDVDFQAVATQLGSEGGDGAAALKDYAVILEDRANEKLDATIAVIEQFSILIPAAFVIFLLLASYLPLFDLVGRVSNR